VFAVHVRDEQERSVANADVLLLDDPYSNPESARTRAVSDVVGKAQIELEEGGSWFLRVSHPSYQTAVVPVPQSDAVKIDQTITLQAGIRIFGTISTALSGARVQAEVILDEWGPSHTRTVTCDAGGLYDTGSVFAADAEVELTARAPGFAEVRRVVDLAKEKIIDSGCRVNLDLEFEEVRIKGRVDGPPGPTDIFLQPLGSGPFIEAGKLVSHAVRWRLQASTGVDGRFEIGMLMAQQGYQLLAAPREGYSNALVRIPGQAPGSVYDLGVLEVEAGGTLFGYAKGEDGRPVPHLHLTGIATIPITWDQMNDPDYFPSREAGRQDAYTTQDGYFEFALLPGETTYTLYWGDGSTNQDHRVGEFTVGSGESKGPILITVPSAESELVSLPGLVLDEGGTRLESILVEAWN
jgi:hypothetical protein